jgi:hypothetical protein
MMAALSAHAHAESSPSYTSLLSAVGFLRFCSPQEVEAIFVKRPAGKRKVRVGCWAWGVLGMCVGYVCCGG